jgi:hypothetical protein
MTGAGPRSSSAPVAALTTSSTNAAPVATVKPHE